MSKTLFYDYACVLAFLCGWHNYCVCVKLAYTYLCVYYRDFVHIYTFIDTFNAGLSQYSSIKAPFIFIDVSPVVLEFLTLSTQNTHRPVLFCSGPL